MKTFWLILVTSFSLSAFAQSPDRILQLHLDYQYLLLTYKEPGVMSESGQFPGIRGQLRWNILPGAAVSVGGYYFDGNLLYDGATFGGVPVKQRTEDYVREYRVLGHYQVERFEFAAGFANRYWFNDMVISYTRGTEYEYIPLIARFNSAPWYFSLEYRLWRKGTNVSTMSRVDPTRRDVTFTQDRGSGYALEAGMQQPFGPIEAKVYLAYDRWDVADSDIRSDGTQNLIEPKNNTTTWILGFGLIF